MVSRADLLKDVTACESTVGQWRDRLAGARSELAEAESTSGEAVVDNPSLVSKVSKRMQAARDEIELAGHAQGAAEERLEQARRRVLEFDALQFDRVADRLKGELVKHRARTDELLAQLDEHEGVYVPEWRWARAARDARSADAPDEWSSPRSESLAEALERERMCAHVLRDVAAGVDPSGRLREAAGAGSLVFGVPVVELYPSAVWGPDAVIPAPAFLSTVEYTRQLLRDLDVKIEKSQAEVNRRSDELAEIYVQAEKLRGPTARTILDGQSATVDPWLSECRTLAQRRRRQIGVAQEWLESGEPRERAELLARLEELTGEKPAAASEPAGELVAS